MDTFPVLHALQHTSTSFLCTSRLHIPLLCISPRTYSIARQARVHVSTRFQRFLFSLSQGKWNCLGVAEEFQHPRAKIILLWSLRTCWSFCCYDSQMEERQRALDLSRCAKCGKHWEKWGKKKRECVQSPLNVLHKRKANLEWWGKLLEIKGRCAWACSVVVRKHLTHREKRQNYQAHAQLKS